jgi:hypothetical protein
MCAAAGYEKAIAMMTDLNSHEEMMVAEASYPLPGSEDITTSDVRAVSFSRHTIRHVETFAKRIDRRSGDPNIQVIGTRNVRVLISTQTSKA